MIYACGEMKEITGLKKRKKNIEKDIEWKYLKKTFLQIGII